MTDPERIGSPLPKERIAEGLRSIVENINSFGRKDYEPEPYSIRSLSPIGLRDIIGAGHDKELIASWSRWRVYVTKARSENESRLGTLLWAVEQYDARGDTFGGGVIRDWLREQWGCERLPAKRGRESFVTNVCAIGARPGILDPTSIALRIVS